MSHNCMNNFITNKIFCKRLVSEVMLLCDPKRDESKRTRVFGHCLKREILTTVNAPLHRHISLSKKKTIVEGKDANQTI